MIVYRLSRTKYADDKTGEGARLHGGRWNHVGVACLYSSQSRALALLEYTVNVGIDDIPRALSMVTMDIPDALIKNIRERDLPGDWKNDPAPSSTKDFGSGLFKAGANLIYQIPSAVIPQEFNYLIDPLHASIALVNMLDVRDFVYDIRIKVPKK